MSWGPPEPGSSCYDVGWNCSSADGTVCYNPTCGDCEGGPGFYVEDDCGNCVGNFGAGGCFSGCDYCGNCNGGSAGCSNSSACNYDSCSRGANDASVCDFGTGDANCGCNNGVDAGCGCGSAFYGSLPLPSQVLAGVTYSQGSLTYVGTLQPASGGSGTPKSKVILSSILGIPVF